MVNSADTIGDASAGAPVSAAVGAANGAAAGEHPIGAAVEGRFRRRAMPQETMRKTGLLQKAKLLRVPARANLRVLRPDELRVEQDDEITPEERERVYSQIDEAVARSRLKVTPETFFFKARKNGGILPILVNSGAVLVLLVGVALALYLSRRTEHAIVASPVALLSAEGKMVETLKEESKQQLESKDREISSIRQRLAGIDQERDRIRQEADASVRQKEQQLQEASAKALEAERARLEASGLSPQAVAARIAAAQSAATARQDAELASFRAQADAERAAREKVIAGLQASYQQDLAQAQAARAQVQSDAARRQADLEAGYKQKQLSLEKDSAAALASLDTLRQQQAGEQLVLDQLLSWYQKARDQIQAGKPDAARAVLTDFRKYLDDPAVAGLPAVSRRRPVDLFLIDSLDDLARGQAEQASSANNVQANVQALSASANLVAAVAALVQQGDALYNDQAYPRARELYLSALARIPAVSAGYDRLNEIQKIFNDRGRKDVAALFAAGNAAYRSGDYEAATASYGRALKSVQDDQAAADLLISQLSDIGARRQAAEDASRIRGLAGEAAARARGIAAVQSLRDALAALPPSTSRSDRVRNTLVALLETKLMVQQTLLKPEVVKIHPDLYDRLNVYFDALSEESRAEARLETLRDIDALLSGIAATGSVPAVSALAPRFASADEQQILLSILGRLDALLK
jgi:hypothetical protein